VKLDNGLDVVTVESENLEQELETIEGRVRLTNSEVDEIREVESNLPLSWDDPDEKFARLHSETWQPVTWRSLGWKLS
jgi:hypothetical protein